ncbi:hypothetical protein [Rhizobium acaciae]|uniref:hypothetical protein n=1 Tax=Rhizobium acaciae TaxID=2989736 RepID=UPI00221E5602|nr:hypothetical protein [Rhizobium acaciae]MCW1754958.1 hypothetical protein [Rhizobium acaciae]
MMQHHAIAAQVTAAGLRLGPKCHAKILLALVAAAWQRAVSLEADHSFVHMPTPSNIKVTGRLAKDSDARFARGLIFSKCTIFAIGLLASYSSAVASGEEIPAREPPANTNAPSSIGWLDPDLKDAATPRTLILCSDRTDEQLRRYRSLIEKLGVLNGYTVLDGRTFSTLKRPAGAIGYIVSAHRGNEDQAVRSCAASYPELLSIVTDAIEKEIPAQQAEFQDLIRFGILPKEAQPFQCFSKQYYSTDGARTWVARVGIDSSSNDRCFNELLPLTFGISPDYCSSSDVCR